jgi:hypothetical protein
MNLKPIYVFPSLTYLYIYTLIDLRLLRYFTTLVLLVLTVTLNAFTHISCNYPSN